GRPPVRREDEPSLSWLKYGAPGRMPHPVLDGWRKTAAAAAVGLVPPRWQRKRRSPLRGARLPGAVPAEQLFDRHRREGRRASEEAARLDEMQVFSVEDRDQHAFAGGRPGPDRLEVVHESGQDV